MRLKTESEIGVHFARTRLLRHVLPISLVIMRKKTDCFAVYGAPKGSDSFISDRWWILTI